MFSTQHLPHDIEDVKELAKIAHENGFITSISRSAMMEQDHFSI